MLSSFNENDINEGINIKSTVRDSYGYASIPKE
jgi:hypothetical protein